MLLGIPIGIAFSSENFNLIKFSDVDNEYTIEFEINI
jgi:hypothetical protein